MSDAVGVMTCYECKAHLLEGEWCECASCEKTFCYDCTSTYDDRTHDSVNICHSCAQYMHEDTLLGIDPYGPDTLEESWL